MNLTKKIIIFSDGSLYYNYSSNIIYKNNKNIVFIKPGNQKFNINSKRNIKPKLFKNRNYYKKIFSNSIWNIAKW